jgi:hypothetical protein
MTVTTGHGFTIEGHRHPHLTREVEKRDRDIKPMTSYTRNIFDANVVLVLKKIIWHGWFC